MKRAALGLALAVAASALWTAPATAQTFTDNDQITATAVVASAITVARVTDLDFGTVLPNFGRTILFTDAGAGHFQVLGAANAEVSLGFGALPATLDDAPNSLTVTFTALYNNDGNPSGGNTFDPAVGVPAANLDGTTGQLHVFMGGTVTAAFDQAAGNYSAMVTLTAAYTGN